MTVTVKMLVDKLKLRVVYGNEKLLSKPITTADISRPGLEMTGYFDFYSPERIQLVGMNRVHDFQHCIPDKNVFLPFPIYFPGTAYNLNFVMETEDAL